MVRKDEFKLEEVQKRATKIIRGMKNYIMQKNWKNLACLALHWGLRKMIALKKCLQRRAGGREKNFQLKVNISKKQIVINWP